MIKKTLLVTILLLAIHTHSFTQESPEIQKHEAFCHLSTSGNLIALWTFDEPPGNPREALGINNFPLKEVNGPIKRLDEGPLSGFSIKLEGKNFLSLENADVGGLNIHGAGAEVTVIAWVKWTREQTGFVGGMWNEYQEGGKRQYGLFISLPHYNGLNQVCGHISKTGKPTPPFPYSIDYSASNQTVPKEEWCCIAFTYDGRFIRSYFNGQIMPRESELISNTKGFEGYPQGLIQSKNPYFFPDGIGDNGSDFTVGAVRLKGGMGNYFKGQIGGIAIYDRALCDDELLKIAQFKRSN